MRLHIHQDHEIGSDDELGKMEITGNNVNHEDKDDDKFEEESVVNSDVEAFKEAPGTTLPPLVNENLKDDLMDTANDTDDQSDESKISETLIGTKGDTQGNVSPPVAGNGSVPEGRKIKHPDPGWKNPVESNK